MHHLPNVTTLFGKEPRSLKIAEKFRLFGLTVSGGVACKAEEECENGVALTHSERSNTSGGGAANSSYINASTRFGVQPEGWTRGGGGAVASEACR